MSLNQHVIKMSFRRNWWYFDESKTRNCQRWRLFEPVTFESGTFHTNLFYYSVLSLKYLRSWRRRARGGQGWLERRVATAGVSLVIHHWRCVITSITAIVQQLCALCATSPRLLQLLVIFIDRHKSRYFYIIMLWNKQRHWKVDIFYISWMYNSNIMQNIITVECAWDV